MAMKSSNLPTVSLIITTYNQPQVLRLVLESALDQVLMPLEIIIADDGSKDETANMIKDVASRSPIPIIHAWQPDQGFRAARSRNNGIAASKGEYLIFLDGDCFLNRYFIQDHITLAKENLYLIGTRVNITRKRQDYILETGNRRISFFSWGTRKKFNAIRSAWLAGFYHRTGGMASANFSLWRHDILAVNGFDERFEGHGGEDVEIGKRLDHLGLVRRRMTHLGMAYHFAHTDNARGDRQMIRDIINETVAEKRVRTPFGLERAMQKNDYEIRIYGAAKEAE